MNYRGKVITSRRFPIVFRQKLLAFAASELCFGKRELIFSVR
jgi:hypothetical protein